MSQSYPQAGPEERAALVDQLSESTARVVHAQRMANLADRELMVHMASVTSTAEQLEQLLTARLLADLEVAVRRAERDRLHIRRATVSGLS